VTNKEMIRNELNGINKKNLIDNLVNKGWKRNTVNISFSKGAISKKLAFMLEDLTSISALFWMQPDIYNKKGEKK